MSERHSHVWTLDKISDRVRCGCGCWMYRRQDGTIVIGPGEFTKADLGVLKQDSGDVIVGSGPGEMS